MEDEDSVTPQNKPATEAAPPARQPMRIKIPRRAPSVVIPVKKPYYPSADKSTCAECTCYPKEEPYKKRPEKRLLKCQKSPKTLYEYAADVVDQFKYPEQFEWTENDVVDWLTSLGLPQYKECILDNFINGRRLLLLEDPYHLAQINIRDLEHIKIITASIREMFGLEMIRFIRSVGLPPRYPLTHCTQFKSRTGPTWGIRRNWTRSDILRWMKIILPEPVYRDHWDLVWYHKPDFPKQMFARVPSVPHFNYIPIYKPKLEICAEYKVPRKFRLLHDLPEDLQFIWMEHPLGSAFFDQFKPKNPPPKYKFLIPKGSNLYPKRPSTEGLKGKHLLLARRKMATPKFNVM